MTSAHNVIYPLPLCQEREMRDAISEPKQNPGVIIQQMDRKLQKLAKESECPKSYFIKKASALGSLVR